MPAVQQYSPGSPASVLDEIGGQPRTLPTPPRPFLYALTAVQSLGARRSVAATIVSTRSRCASASSFS